jgi:flagellar basal body rod protein FlgC
VTGGQTLYPSLSGLRDATVRLDVAANNIANLPSEGFAPSRVFSAEAPGGGVEPTVIQDGDGVDLVTEMVGLMMARLAFSANLSALAQTFETQRSLLDLTA